MHSGIVLKVHNQTWSLTEAHRPLLNFNKVVQLAQCHTFVPKLNLPLSHHIFYYSTLSLCSFCKFWTTLLLFPRFWISVYSVPGGIKKSSEVAFRNIHMVFLSCSDTFWDLGVWPAVSFAHWNTTQWLKPWNWSRAIDNTLLRFTVRANHHW